MDFMVLICFSDCLAIIRALCGKNETFLFTPPQFYPVHGLPRLSIRSSLSIIFGWCPPPPQVLIVGANPKTEYTRFADSSVWSFVLSICPITITLNRFNDDFLCILVISCVYTRRNTPPTINAVIDFKTWHCANNDAPCYSCHVSITSCRRCFAKKCSTVVPFQ